MCPTTKRPLTGVPASPNQRLGIRFLVTHLFRDNQPAMTGWHQANAAPGCSRGGAIQKVPDSALLEVSQDIAHIRKRAGPKQLDTGSRGIQRSNHHELLVGDVEALARGGDHLYVRTVLRDGLGNPGRALDDVFALSMVSSAGRDCNTVTTDRVRVRPGCSMTPNVSATARGTSFGEVSPANSISPGTAPCSRRDSARSHPSGQPNPALIQRSRPLFRPWVP